VSCGIHNLKIFSFNTYIYIYFSLRNTQLTVKVYKLPYNITCYNLSVTCHAQI
jgi:hypothetical protein